MKPCYHFIIIAGDQGIDVERKLLYMEENEHEPGPLEYMTVETSGWLIPLERWRHELVNVKGRGTCKQNGAVCTVFTFIGMWPMACSSGSQPDFLLSPPIEAASK